MDISARKNSSGPEGGLKPIIFWGATGQAKVLGEFVPRLGYTLVAVFDNDPAVGSPFPGVPIYHGEKGFARWRENTKLGEVFGLAAIGGARGEDRVRLQSFLGAHGVRPIVAVHPTAFVANGVRIGGGSQILAGAAVCVDVEMRECCIINTAATVDHECRLGRGVHIAPGAVLAGCVNVGDYSMIGTGAIVLPRVKIGANVVIGAGSIVTRDIPANKIAYGNPARVRRENPTAL